MAQQYMYIQPNIWYVKRRRGGKYRKKRGTNPVKVRFYTVKRWKAFFNMKYIFRTKKKKNMIGFGRVRLKYTVTSYTYMCAFEWWLLFDVVLIHFFIMHLQKQFFLFFSIRFFFLGLLFTFLIFHFFLMPSGRLPGTMKSEELPKTMMIKFQNPFPMKIIYVPIRWDLFPLFYSSVSVNTFSLRIKTQTLLHCNCNGKRICIRYNNEPGIVEDLRMAIGLPAEIDGNITGDDKKMVKGTKKVLIRLYHIVNETVFLRCHLSLQF